MSASMEAMQNKLAEVQKLIDGGDPRPELLIERDSLLAQIKRMLSLLTEASSGKLLRG